MGHIRSNFLLISGLILLIASPIRADARGDADGARRQLDWAEHRLTQVCFELEQARAALNDAAARQSGAIAGLQAAAAQVQASQRALADAHNGINSAAGDAQAARNRSGELKAVYDSAAARVEAAQQEIEKYRNAAIATFESSPAFEATGEDLAAAQAAYEREVADTFAWLRSTDVYADLFDAVDETEEQVQRQRELQPSDPAALAAASQAWMDAKNALERFKADVMAADPLIADAKKALDAATAARQTLVERFNRDLGGDENIKSLAAKVAEQRRSLELATADLNNSEAQRQKIESEIARLQSCIDTENQRLAQAQRDAPAFELAANSAASEAAYADAQVRRLCDAELLARRERDFAARGFREVIARADSQRQRHEIDVRQAVARFEPEHASRDLLAAERERRERDLSAQRDRETRDSALRDRRARDGLASKAAANLAEKQRLSRLNSEQAAEERQRIEDAQHKREKAKQREQVENDRAAADKQREEQTRRDQDKRETKARAERDAQEAQARAERDQRQAKAEKDSQQAQAKAERDQRQEKAEKDSQQAQAKAERDQRQAKVEEGRREAKAEQAKRDDESRKRADDDAKRRSDDDRRRANDARAQHDRDESRGRDQDRGGSFRKH